MELDMKDVVNLRDLVKEEVAKALEAWFTVNAELSDEFIEQLGKKLDARTKVQQIGQYESMLRAQRGVSQPVAVRRGVTNDLLRAATPLNTANGNPPYNGGNKK